MNIRAMNNDDSSAFPSYFSEKFRVHNEPSKIINLRQPLVRIIKSMFTYTIDIECFFYSILELILDTSKMVDYEQDDHVGYHQAGKVVFKYWVDYKTQQDIDELKKEIAKNIKHLPNYKSHSVEIVLQEVDIEKE